jgi:DNA repair ATPase RecN
METSSFNNILCPVNLSSFGHATVIAGVSAMQLSSQELMQPSDYTDEELVIFLTAAIKVMPLQQESQMKMVEKIEDQDLTVDEFNSILDAHSTGEGVKATREELEAFNKAIESIQEIQLEYQEIITEVIEDEGLSAQRYENIIVHYQQDPKLQARINSLMKKMENQDQR